MDDKFAQSFKEPIEDVGSSTKQLVFSKYRHVAVPWLIFAALWFFVIFALFTGKFDLDVVFWLALVPIILFVGWWGRIRQKVHSAFMYQFARRNNFRYLAKSLDTNRAGLIFAFGHSRSLFNEVSGNVGEFSVKLYNYKSKTGAGKNEVEHQFTIFEVEANNEIPQLFLNSHKAPFMSDSNKPVNLSSDNILKLEGDFNKYFNLYVPVQYEQEALQIFTPDIMAELIDTSQNYDLEIVGKTVRVIAKDYITNIKVLDEMFNHAKSLIKLFEKTLTKFKYELIGDFSPELKPAPYRYWGIIVGFIIVVLAFIMAMAVLLAA